MQKMICGFAVVSTMCQHLDTVDTCTQALRCFRFHRTNWNHWRHGCVQEIGSTLFLPLSFAACRLLEAKSMTFGQGSSCHISTWMEVCTAAAFVILAHQLRISSAAGSTGATGRTGVC